VDRQYVGIDLHRRRCVIVRKSAAGEKLSSVRVANDALEIASAVAEAGPNPEVVIEATYGWYWVVDLLQEQGATVHLANPSGLNWGTRRVKNDERDAVDLIDMLRLGRLPEAWIAPPATRELRELVRYRAKLVALRSGLKAQVHAVMAKEGVLPAVTDMFCQAGNTQLDALELADAYATRVQSLRTLIDAYDHEVARLEAQIRNRLRGHRGYRAIQAINGIGPTMAAILVAEIGDVTRFRSAPALCSWAGLTPASTNRTPKPGAARSPSRDHCCCAGRSLRASAATTAAMCSSTATSASPSGAARTRHASRSHARPSRSPTTGYAMARSAASRQLRRQRETRTRSCRELEDRHDASPELRVVELIEPDTAAATDPIMRGRQRGYMPRQPSLPTLLASSRRAHRREHPQHAGRQPIRTQASTTAATLLSRPNARPAPKETSHKA
jgi:transposase